MSKSRLLSSPASAGWARAGNLAVSAEQGTRSAEQRAERYFLEFGEPVFRYLVHTCRNRSEAEELRQETFLRLYQALQRDEAIVSIAHWLFKVARNLMLDRAKHLRRIAPKIADVPADALTEVADPQPTPETQLFAKRRNEALAAAIEELTPLQRECILLRAQNLQLRQIGDILGMDARRVAEAIDRAVTRLQKALHV